MEKIKPKVIKREEVEHHFYCDGCNTYLGASIEHDDGYYQHIGEFEESVHIGGTWLRLSGTYCEDCAHKLRFKIYKTLIDMGFEKQ